DRGCPGQPRARPGPRPLRRALLAGKLRPPRLRLLPLGLRSPDRLRLELEPPLADGPLEPTRDPVPVPRSLACGPRPSPGRQPPGESVALIPVADEHRDHLDHRPTAPRLSPCCGCVTVARGRPAVRR